LTISWSDDESKKDGENESTKHVTALTGRFISGDESCELVYDKLAVSYKTWMPETRTPANNLRSRRISQVNWRWKRSVL